MSIRLTELEGVPVDFDELHRAVAWEQRSVTVFGRIYPQPRLTCWYGEVPYVYSGLRWEALPMPPLIDRLRQRVEAMIGEGFNSCLCNRYRDGSDSVGWHADDEPLFGGDPVVASLSFGAPRTFKLRRNDRTAEREFVLHHGSLLVMGRGIQREWQHTLPKTRKPCGERINLTFRQTVCLQTST